MNSKLFAMMSVWLVLGGPAGKASDFCWESVGVRQGISSKRGEDAFYQTEAFANWRLPWAWEYSSGWEIATRLDLTAGGLLHNEEVGFVGTLGPSFTFGYKDFPLRFDAGSSPTLLSRDEFGHTNYGVPFQFTSHAGFALDLGKHVIVSYRFQHMSNAGISEHNPGLNLHAFGFGYRF